MNILATDLCMFMFNLIQNPFVTVYLTLYDSLTWTLDSSQYRRLLKTFLFLSLTVSHSF